MPKPTQPPRQPCRTCQGKGWTVVQKTRIKNGKVVTEPEHEPCTTCQGSGWAT